MQEEELRKALLMVFANKQVCIYSTAPHYVCHDGVQREGEAVER